MGFINDTNIVAKALSDHQQNNISGESPTITLSPINDLLTQLDCDGLIQLGGLTGTKLKEFVQLYLQNSTSLHNPGYLGHQCAAPHYSAALSAFIDAHMNNVTAIYEMGPAASAIEFFMVNWMLEKVGWQTEQVNASSQLNEGGGVFVNGGSMANLLCLIAARKFAIPNIYELGSLGNQAYMVAENAHYSITKAIEIMGVGQTGIYPIPLKRNGSINTDTLNDVLTTIRQDQKIPVCLVANACNTAIGTYDDLTTIGAFCQQNDLWLHIDGAHGASALLSSKHRIKLKGIQSANSLIWDAHKMMQTPSLCAAALVRNKQHLNQAMHQEASYLFHEKENPGIDFLHRTIECTKGSLATKLFFSLAHSGEKALEQFIDSQYQMALTAYELLQKTHGIEVAISPESNILCFRFDSLSDANHLRLRDLLHQEGSFYITTTAFNNRTFLRLVFMNENTRLKHIKELIQKLMMLSKELLNDNTVPIQNDHLYNH